MMEKEKLRKTDIFSGAAVSLTGLFIIGQAMQMPMKDSWGGVQNVWYVSPALFPLFIGAMLLLLGGLLMKTALRSVGLEGLRSVVTFLFSKNLGRFLKQKDSVRYYGATVNLLIFVFLLVPYVDFFLAAMLFLLVLFCMYYCGDHAFLTRLLWSSLAVALVLGVFTFSGINDELSKFIAFPVDWLVLMLICALVTYSAFQFRTDPEQFRRYKLSLLIGLSTPMIVGIIFKYFLMVPMPFEGMIVTLLDAIWYADMWS